MPFRECADDRTQAKSAGFRTQAGFSLVELAVAVVILVVLAAVAINKFLPIQVDAEQAMLESTIGNLRSALGIKVASSIARDELAAIANLAGSNPMDLLTDPPRSYRGALAGSGTGTVEGGEWFFDTTARVLVYRVRNADGFRGGFGPPAEARFALVAQYQDRNRNGRRDPGEPVEGIRIEALRPYSWAR